MSETEDEELDGKCVKITLVGEPLTGKSSICNRYLGGGGVGGGVSGSTQGAEVFAAQWIHTSLQLCDVAGAALHTTMLPNYLYASDIVIFVYDITNLQSFEKLDIWVKTVNDIFETETKKPLMALFGNKSDLEHQRAVRISCVQKFASEYLLENFKGSARTGEMIFAVFSNLISRVLGTKIPLEVEQTKRRIENQISHEISDQTTHSIQEATNLIMSRKVLRKIQRKSPSSLCSLQ